MERRESLYSSIKMVGLKPARLGLVLLDVKGGIHLFGDSVELAIVQSLWFCTVSSVENGRSRGTEGLY